MNWKVALLIITAVFAPVVATAATSLSTPKLGSKPTFEKTALRIVFEPTGDPIGGPHTPH